MQKLSTLAVLGAIISTTMVFSAEPPRIDVAISPHDAWIESLPDGQRLSLDVIAINNSSLPVVLDAMTVQFKDRHDQVVLERRIDSRGALPSIQTIPNRSLDPGAHHLYFNPIDRLPRALEVREVKFSLQWSAVGVVQKIRSEARVSVAPFRTSNAFKFPLIGRVLVWDGHDFLAHHRRWDYTNPLLASLGYQTNAMRYAYDFVVLDLQGRMSNGPEDVNTNWFGFAAPVFAVGSGTVISLAINEPDDRQFNSERARADPNSLFGNYIVIDHGRKTFSLYGHLKYGSVSVGVGDRVKAGQPIARIGASGSAEFPHLHFQFQDGPTMASEGLPAAFRALPRRHEGAMATCYGCNPETGEVIEDR